MTNPVQTRYAHICHICGSDHVTRDAWATWDVAAQDWVIETLFDHAHCHHCLGPTRAEQVVLSSAITFAAPKPPAPTLSV
ncbi:MAG: hypothetical protein U9R77_03535 [Pseudomonadota bacterium]|uniref:hypothetical protein n=1 Tax=Sphingobium naphthae TaxID=1886786 RepID=UPI002B068B1E|nr:hypothetical protein [Pseudomonadota bacterium]